MAYEVLAAVIQGGCTIGAAALAVIAARSGLEAWRREAPGRRRIELAEQCLVVAYATQKAIGAYESGIVLLMGRDTGSRSSWSSRNQMQREDELVAMRKRLDEDLRSLRSITELTALYFEDDLILSYDKMGRYFEKVDDWFYHYRKLCNSEEDQSDEKKNLMNQIRPDFDTPERVGLSKLQRGGIACYEAVLASHLKVLAKRPG